LTRKNDKKEGDKKAMADSSNLALARRLYDNLKSPEVLMEVLSESIEWEIATGFPYGGKYVGTQSVFQDFFGRLMNDFEDWSTVAREIHDAGDHVIAIGTYTARAKATGKTFTASFSHLWTVKDGKMVRMRQCADTVQVIRSLEA
jgi:ketosteroid isomerase-like protein